MSPFELVFAMFGLLLGLALAELLGGFARVLKLSRSVRAQVRIGWLTPLLGLFVMLDLTSFWIMAWSSRDRIEANYPTLLAVLAIVGTYYLASTLIFPEDPEEWPDFDLHYDQQNRHVLGGMLAANIGSMIGQGVLEATGAPPPAAAAQPLNEAALAVAGLAALLILILLIALMIVKSRRANAVLLGLLILLVLVAGFADALI